MIDGSEKCNRQLAFELQNSHVVKSAVTEIEKKKLSDTFSLE